MKFVQLYIGIISGMPTSCYMEQNEAGGVTSTQQPIRTCRAVLRSYPQLYVFAGTYDLGKRKQITLAPQRPIGGSFVGLVGEELGRYENREAWRVAMAHWRLL